MSPPWMIEKAKIAASVIYLGVVESVKPDGILDDHFAWNLVEFRVRVVFRPELSDAAGRVDLVRCLTSIHSEPPMIAGVGPSYHSFNQGDQAVIFTTSWGGEMLSYYVEPGIHDQVRYSMMMLAQVKSGDLWILRASENVRAAQQRVYERIIEAT